MIGGTDVVLWTRDAVPISDIIFRIVRRHWPEAVFENLEDEEGTSRPVGPGLPQPSDPEYFIFRNTAAARSWDEHGAVPENHNTMLYVIEGTRRSPDRQRHSLTMVCGELNGEMAAIVGEIEAGIQDFESLADIAEVAA
jgi:hypothetical protein